ncbi:hypothetical protein VTK73DRAFT_6925 [Phialemonium thermophilum]|uniref:Uncharacterized protein n=1 Tax=Phialemonium thermophilum TaxID=223376 RepID=A0ABR3WHJ3_9PEZI
MQGKRSEQRALLRCERLDKLAEPKSGSSTVGFSLRSGCQSTSWKTSDSDGGGPRKTTAQQQDAHVVHHGRNYDRVTRGGSAVDGSTASARCRDVVVFRPGWMEEDTTHRQALFRGKFRRCLCWRSSVDQISRRVWPGYLTSPKERGGFGGGPLCHSQG